MTTEQPASPVTPSTIKNLKFRIPLYQRPYAWEPDQVNRLLADLHAAFEETPDSHYHIGILSVAPSGDEPDRFDLIDGQQRITTLLLIGRVASAHASEWHGFLTSNRLYLYGRREDQAYLDGSAPTGVGPNVRMAEADRCITNFFDGLEAGQRAPFARYVYEHAAFLLSVVPEGYSLLDKNQQFVRLNNRGKQLEKHEILKVRLVSRLDGDRDKAKEAFEVWNAMASLVSGQDSAGNNEEKTLAEILADPSPGLDPTKEALTRSLVSIPEFLLIALARHLERQGRKPQSFSHSQDRLLQTFEDLGTSAEIHEFFELLKTQTQLLKRFFVLQSLGGDYSFHVDSETMEERSIAFGHENGITGHGSATLRAWLSAVQSFLSVSTEPHHWLIPSLDWCERSQTPDGKVNAADFVAELERIDNALLIGKQRKASSIESEAAMSYQQVSHYWFYRLDYELWKGYHKICSSDEVWAGLPREDRQDGGASQLVRGFRFRRCGSVEHINPKNPMEAAPGSVRADHSFGNLALISGSRNSKFSNLPLEAKKQAILQSGYTESLKMVHFLWCNPDSKISGETMHGLLRSAAFQCTQ